MKSKKSLLIIVGALLVVLVIAAIAYNYLTEKAGSDNKAPANAAAPANTASDNTGSTEGGKTDTSAENQKTPLPSVTITDSNGSEVQLSSFTGKPTIINIWTSWCTYCVQEMPDFQSAYETYGEEINFVMLNSTTANRESKDAADAFIAQNGYTFPVFYDQAGEVLAKLGIRGYPTSFVVDAEGYIVGYAPGAIDINILIETAQSSKE